jgi:hypothetical protein
MATNEILKQSLEHFRQQRQRKVEELRALDTTIQQLQLQLGETPDVLELSVSSATAVSDSVAANTGAPYNPRADEFFGMSQSEAAKAFLERVGRAVSLDELVRGLKSGGCKVGGVDPKKTLYISLVRNVREFVPVQSGVIGLRKFYPNVTRPGRPSNAEVQNKKRKKAKHRRKVESKKDTNARVKKATRGMINEAVRKIMGDHALRTPEQLHDAVKSQVSPAVEKISVVGALRHKDFEQVDDKYRLRQPSEAAQVIQ